mgnify:CR=1 FL=1
MKNVLLIDDDIMEHKLMHVFLTCRYEDDFGLTYVDNLDDGIEALQGHAFDTVFIDNFLPPYTGAHETYPIISLHVGGASLIYISSGFLAVDLTNTGAARKYNFIDKLELKDRIMNGLLDA